MARLPHRCVMISVCLAGALLLLPLCLGFDDHDVYNVDYDSTQTPEYDDYHNSTFEYTFFSNVSSEELEKFLRETETEKETVGGVHEEKPTRPTVFNKTQASQSTPVCFLLTLVLMVHPLLRLL